MLKKVFSMSALGLAIFLPAAFATPIANNTGTTVLAGGSGFTGTLVADTGVQAFNTSAYVNGTLQQQVYRESGGSLDFYYLVTNSANSLDNIGRFTTNNFTGFSTNVSYLSIPTGATTPSDADRSGAGDTVGFNFHDAGGNTLAPGASSAWLEISTDATAFAFTGTSNIIDGGVGTVDTYSPTAATPEPMSMSLLGAGLAGFGLLSLRRRSAKK